MGITITEDEHDKAQRGIRETRKEIVRKHARDNTDASEELGVLELAETSIVNPDPTKAYHLVNRGKDGQYISRKKGMGYKTVSAESDAKLHGHAVVDGQQVYGDLILMETPVANYEKRRAMKLRKWQHMSGERTEAAKERMNKIARDAGLTGPHKDAVE